MEAAALSPVHRAAKLQRLAENLQDAREHLTVAADLAIDLQAGKSVTEVASAIVSIDDALSSLTEGLTEDED